MRYFILFSILAVNSFLAFLALSPSLITYAEIIPQAVQCSLCNNPEVQKALIEAASFGRGQITALIQSNSISILLICLGNCFLFTSLLFTPNWLNRKIKDC